MNERGYLSIGDALAMLLEEFPDITISKIRFLESQGLITPERTAAGYRMFRPVEVEKLRIILREQQEHFLPLRVIKDRLDDETSDISRELMLAADAEESVRNHPSRRAMPQGFSVPPRPADGGLARATANGTARTFDEVNHAFEEEQRRIALAHADMTSSLERTDMRDRIGASEELIDSLESSGMLKGHRVGAAVFYDESETEIVRLAQQLVEMGIDHRHIRTWKSVVDRLVVLFEQRTLPMFRQKSGAVRQDAEELLGRLGSTGAELLDLLLRSEIDRLRSGR